LEELAPASSRFSLAIRIVAISGHENREPNGRTGMRASTMKYVLIRLALVSSWHSSASANGLPFTWDPSQAVPGLAGGAFTADTILREEFLRGINQSDGSFLTPRIVVVTGFSLNGAPVTPAGFGSAYGLYFDIVDTGIDHLPDSITFTSSNFTLKADPGNHNGPASATTAGIGFANTGPTGTADDITLATGSLVMPASGLDAPIVQSFTPAAGQGGFFVSPAPSSSIYLETINTTLGPLTFTPQPDGTGITTINGGGFSQSQFVPEPASLVVLGTALGGIAMIRRRRT
jgi:hypothetical protein